MANYFDTGILLTAGFSLSSQAPLDGRSVVELLTDLDAHIAENRAYEGMCVYVKENKKIYIYNGTTWEEFVGGGSAEPQIKDWVSGNSYLEGDYIYHEGEIYRCLTSNNDVDFDETNWKQLTYDIDELLEEGGSGVYSTTTPVNNPIGGIKRGDEFTNKPISEIIDLMLHVVERVKVALSSSVSGGIREIGDTSISTSTFTVTVTKGTNPVTSVKLFKDSVEVQDFADVENGGSFTYDGGVITTNTSFVAKANDGEGEVSSSAVSYKFVSPMYIGSSNNGLDVFSEVDATGLTKKIVDKNTKTIQAFTHTQQHMCFVVPNTWNNTPTIKDQNNFDITTAFSKKTIQITGLDGVARDYIAFVSNDKSTLSNYSITITF